MKYYIIIFFCFLFINSFCQTGIGTTSPDPSAKLDVSSSNKGFLPPRVSLTDAYDRTTITNPATGLLVYCKGDAGLSAGYYFWNGSAWATIATAGGSGSVAAEYGSQFLGTTAVTIPGSTTSSSATLILSFNLPSIGTWEIISFVRGYLPSTSSAIEFGIFDPSGNLINNSETLINWGANAVTATNAIQITNTSAGTYTLKAWSNSGGGQINTDGNGRTGVSWKKISGNAPVTGQSVDYGIARYTGNDASSLSANAAVQFDATAKGNLSWNNTNNRFTLKANKTYEIESYLSIYHASVGVAGVFQIYNYTQSDILASGLYMSINGTGGYNVNANGPMRCVITPTTDIEVGVRIVSAYGGWPSIVGSTNTIGANGASNQSYLLVKQIGSSAIVNPWVLSGNDVYNTTGKVGIGTNAPAYTLDVSGTAKLTSTPSITTATSVLVKDPATSQISEQPISFVTGIAKIIRNTSQGSVSNGTVVLLNTTSNNTISNYVALNNGVITLQSGTYELNGSVGALAGSSGYNGDCRVYGVFHNGTNYVGTGGVSETGPAGNWNGMPQNEANYIVTVPSGQTVQLTLKAAIVNNTSLISDIGDYGNIGDAGRAWVVVRKYN